ncbi:MAG: hypothetical protein AAF560_04565 [Acidobacteriota bacterium]
MSDSVEMSHSAGVSGPGWLKRLGQVDHHVASKVERVVRDLEDLAVAAEEEAVARLLAATARIDGEKTQSDILLALLEEGRRFASRTAFFLTRPGEVRGWAGRGFGEGVAVEALQLDFSDDGVWARLAKASGTLALDPEGCSAVCEQLEAEPGSHGVLIPFILRGQLGGALYADRLAGEGAPARASLQLLTHSAAQAIETAALRGSGVSPTLRSADGESDEKVVLWQPPEVATADDTAAAAESVASEAPVDLSDAKVAAIAAAAGVAAVAGAAVAADEPAEAIDPAEPEDAADEAIDQVALAAEPETATEPEAATEPEIAAEPEAAAEPEVATEAEIAAEPEAAVEPEVATEPEAAVEPEVATEAEIAAESEIALEPAVDEPDTSAEVESTREIAIEGVEELEVEELGDVEAQADDGDELAAGDSAGIDFEMVSAPETETDLSSEAFASQELEAIDDISEDLEPEPELEDTSSDLWATDAGKPETTPAPAEAPPASASFAQPQPPMPSIPAVGQETVRLDLAALQGQVPAAGAPPAAEVAPPAPEVTPSTTEVTPPAEEDTAKLPQWEVESAPTSEPAAPSYDLEPEVAEPVTEPMAKPDFGTAAEDTSEDPTIMTSRSNLIPEPPPAEEPTASPMAGGYVPPAPSEVTPPPSTGFAAPPPKPDSTGSTQVVPPTDIQGPGSAFGAAGGIPDGEAALHEEARRLARLLVSEIKLYNEEIIEEGRRAGNIYERLKDDIDRSRQMYEERIDPRLKDSGNDYFHQELVQRLAGGDKQLLGY